MGGWPSVVSVTLALALAEPAPAAPKATGARLTEQPRATRSSDGTVRITFAVSAAADVEVAVLDAKGAIVRHLAAGLLGPNAPAPFKKNSLAQEVLWDGKDDAGRPAAGFAGPSSAAGGPFKARVRVGLKPGLDRFVGWDANTMTGPIVGLAVDRRGNLFALDADARMKVFDRSGAYLRTIMPYPANTPAERTASVGHLEIEGERLPLVYTAHADNLSVDGLGTVYPLTKGFAKQGLALSPRGHIVMASALGTYIEHGLPRHLLALSVEGGAPPGMNFVGPKVREPNNFLGGAGERGAPWFDHLALSSDGEFIYFNQAGESSRFKRSHAVFRLRWADEQLGPPFLGQVEPGNDEAHFNDPQGIAVDAAGNLYVCDRGNNRVVVFSSEGKRLGEFAVDAPEQIAVHPQSGEIYLVSRRKEPKKRPEPETTLRKFSPWTKGEPREMAVLALKTIEVMALDAWAEPPIVWAAVNTGWGRPNEVVSILDRGDRFHAGPSIINHSGLEHPANLVADPARNRLILRERDHVFLRRELLTVDLATGKKEPFLVPAPGPVPALDRAGNVYVASDYNREGIDRFDPSGKPLPFSALGTNHIAWGGRNPHWSRGLTVAPDGRIYVLRNVVRHQAGQLDVYASDGTLQKSDLIRGLDRGACGVGVDAAGNVYVAVNIKPKDHPLPAAFAGQVPARPWWFWYVRPGRTDLWGERPAPWSYTFYNPYLWHWGSLLKFGPDGGAIYGLRPQPREATTRPADVDPLCFAKNAPADAPTYTTAIFEQEVKVVGAQWVRQGYGLVPSSTCNWGDPGCGCATSGFAVDPFGRAFYPNAFRFCVEAVDPAGNALARIGTYGNADSRGPGSPVPEPPIPFAWPAFVAQAEDRLYISDSVNQRVVVVRLDYAVAAEVALP